MTGKAQRFFAPPDRPAREGSAAMAVPETQARLRAAGVEHEVPMWREAIERAGIER